MAAVDSAPLRSPWLWLGLAAVLLLVSCRATPLAPRAPGPASPAGAGPGARHPHGESLAMPFVRHIRAEVLRDTLVIQMRLDPVAVGLRRPYAPDRAGGWMLQLFMNTDQAPTGYAWGADYLVRGGEVLPDGRFVIRRVEPGDDFPGGWGPQSGAARFRLRPQDFVLAVPLAAIGDDDGRLDFVLETYLTVSCNECAGGVTHEWAADFFGTTNPRLTAGVDGYAAPDVVLLTRAEATRAGRFRAGASIDRRRGDTARW